MMPNSLKGMVAPTVMLWFCLIAWGVAHSLAPDSQLPWRADLVSRLALPLVIASWVGADARKRGRTLCYDYDSFVFFSSPFIVPVYLFQTRGIRAFVTLLCFAGICLVAATMVLVISIIRQFAQ
jgi:hypothetical protein